MIGPPAAIIRADARHLPIADESVDLVVTSPPYFALRSYQDGGEHYDDQIGAEPTLTEYVAALLEVTAECMRVLSPTGSLWVNLGDKYSGAQAQNIGGANRAGDSARTWKQTDPNRRGIPNKSLMGVPWRYALACIDDLGLILRAEIIWSKPNALPESVTDRVRRSHETWFHFTMSPHYFSAVDTIREAYRQKQGPRGRAPNAANPQTGGAPTNHPRNTLGALPGSVWTIATEPLQVPEKLGVNHFAAFPTEWPRRIIQGWSAPGMTILDPFGGTGTTALVARATGRQGIAVDRSADYCRIAQWRTNDRNQLARVLDVPRAEPTPEDQPTLFDLGP